MKGVTIEGSARYDGEYELDLGLMRAVDYGLIKRLTGYLGAEVPEAIAGIDLELICAIAVVALRNANLVASDDGEQEARRVYAELTHLEAGAVRLDLGEAEEEDDAGPPERSSNSNGDFSGESSRTSSETSPPRLKAGGATRSATSELVRVRSVS